MTKKNAQGVGRSGPVRSGRVESIERASARARVWSLIFWDALGVQKGAFAPPFDPTEAPNGQIQAQRGESDTICTPRAEFRSNEKSPEWIKAGTGVEDTSNSGERSQKRSLKREFIFATIWGMWWHSEVEKLNFWIRGGKQKRIFGKK